MAGSTSIASIAAGVAMVGLLSIGTCANADELSGQAFLCARARPARAPRGLPPLPAFHPRRALPVVDRYSQPSAGDRHTLDVIRIEAFCRPLRLEGGAASESAHGFAMYRARRTPRRPMPAAAGPVVESLASVLEQLRLRVGTTAGLAAPTLSADVGVVVAPEPDHLACHDVRSERTSAARRRPPRRIVARSGAADRVVEVRAPRRLCVPASLRGEDPGAVKHGVDVLCYEARVARAPGEPRTELVATRNGFGHEVLQVGAPRWLCVAATVGLALPGS